jgi:excisionase family DNA binding protein
MADWLSVKEVAELLKISRRQVINKINAGQLKAKRQGRLWLIHKSLSENAEEIEGTSQELPETSQDFSKEVIRLEEMVDLLKKQVVEKDQQLSQQQAIIMQLSRNQQLMLESTEQKRRGWWSRLFKRDGKE